MASISMMPIGVLIPLRVSYLFDRCFRGSEVELAVHYLRGWMSGNSSPFPHCGVPINVHIRYHLSEDSILRYGGVKSKYLKIWCQRLILYFL